MTIKRWHAWAMAGAVGLAGGGGVLRLRTYASELPSLEALTTYTPSLVTRILDVHGEPIAELFTEHRTLVPLSRIPVDLQNAVIATEDNQFFRHWGLDMFGIARAFLANLRARRTVQGGSTITQQLAKAAFLTQERTVERKIKEVLLAIQLEQTYTKEEILELYLNQIYFGTGAYGVEAAARVYFGKPVQDLTLPECALLAGLPRAPSLYSPRHDLKRARKRRGVVLRRMRDLGFITPEEETRAAAAFLGRERFFIPTAHAPYFVEYVRQALEPRYGSNALYRGGLKIFTTLDLVQQRAAEAIMETSLADFDLEAGASRTPSRPAVDPTRQEEVSTGPVRVQGSLIALDPQTGQIRALVGGRSFQESQFNRATQAKRQPGSAFKPFIYAAALIHGYTPVSMIPDARVVYYNDGRDWSLLASATGIAAANSFILAADPDRIWEPENYSRKYYGPVMLRQALEHSLNVCAVRVLDAIRPAAAMEAAQRLGVESPLQPNLSLALGSNEVTLLEMVRAFATLSHQGVRTTPYGVLRVEDHAGTVLEENFPKEEEAIPAQTAYVLTNLLRGVVEHGTGRVARALRRPAAGKTGTTNEFSDAWFVGYTPQLATGVWVGYDDRRPLGNKMTGGRVACPIWTGFMEQALSGQPVLDFPVPPGIVFARVDPHTGFLALENIQDAYLDAFIKGTEPKDYFPAPTSTRLATPGEEEPDHGLSRGTTELLKTIPAGAEGGY